MAHLNPFDEAIRAALVPRAPPAYSGLLDAPWQTEGQLRSSTIFCGGQMQADPIFTPLFTALLGTGGFTIFGTTVSYAAIASAIAVTALTIGLQYLMAPKPPKPEDGRVSVMEPLSYRFFGVGECRAAGATMLLEAKGPRLLSVQAIMGHRVQGNTAGTGYEEYWLNDDQVTLSGNVVQAPAGFGDRYAGSVWLYSRMGLVPETAIADIVSNLSGAGIWTNDHRGDGQASLGMLAYSPEAKDFSKKFPFGRPSASVVGKWARVWDFRDPAQNPDDPETWVWSDNSILCLAWHLFFNPFGEKLDFRKALLPVLDMWQEEADVCDESVPLAVGGTEKRYRCSGIDQAKNGPKAATNAILASMDGWMCTRGDGAILIVAGKFREKYCVTLTDAEIIGSRIENDVLFEDECNLLTPIFNYPATGFSTQDADSFQDVEAQIIAGRVLSQEARYDWVTFWRQARRLGLRDWKRLQQKMRGHLYVNLAGINAVYAPWVRLQAPAMLPRLNDKVISNRKATLDIMKGGFQIDFLKMPDNPADIDLWTPGTDEGSAPPVPQKPASEGIPKPIVDTLNVIANGGSVYLRMTLIDPVREDLSYRLRYRVKDIGGGTAGAWVEQSFTDVEPDSGLLLLNTNPVPGDQVLQVQAVYVGSNGKSGPYSDTEEINSTVDGTPPVALIGFTVSDGTGSFIANFGTENDGHLASVAIYRVAVGAPISPRPTPATSPAVSPGISYAIPVTAPAGSWDIYAEPKNRSGIPGPLEGPETVTVS